MIVRLLNKPTISKEIDIMIIWFDDRKELNPTGRYVIKHTTREVLGRVKSIIYKMNVNTLHRDVDDKNILLNDIARVQIECAEELFFDSYSKNRITGSLILIDEQSNNTVGAGLII